MRKPIRPLWVSPDTSQLPAVAADLPFYPIICVSASKYVLESNGIERRSGFTYVQGSGDDHELWSKVLRGLPMID